MDFGTRANTFPKRWKDWHHYGLKFKKTSKVLKETTHNKLYKIAKWNKDHWYKYNCGYCYICGSKCVGWWGKKNKRNRGKKPKYKEKPWRKYRNFKI